LIPAVGAIVLLGVLSPVAAGYSQPGDYGFDYRVEDIPGVYETMEDSRLYYPDSSGAFPPSSVPCPIVVLGHGFQMGIDRYYSYAEHLASWGYVTVLPTFSNPIWTPEHYTRARCMVDAALYAAELGQIPGDPFYGNLDAASWGFTGHSMGGGCAFLAADTFDLEDTLQVVVSFCSPQTTPPVESADLEVPKLVLAGSVDNIAPWEEVREAMWADAPAPGAFAVIAGANHGYCMDYSYWWENGGTATITREEQQAVIRTYLTAYMERYLHGDASPWNWQFCYGDSILLSPAMDSVEVRPESGTAGPSSAALPVSGITSVCPNPFRAATSVSYSLANPGRVRMTALDLSGRTVALLRDSYDGAGDHAVSWNGSGRLGAPVPPGVYLIRMEGPAGIDVRPAVRLD